MITHIRLRVALISLASLASASVAVAAFAESGNTLLSTGGFGTISVEQRQWSGSTILGKWTLLQPSDKQQVGTNPQTTLTSQPAGTYTLLVSPPSGATTTIRVYRNGLASAEATITHPQATFVLNPNDDVQLVINYSFSDIGLVAVESDPPGVDFRMTGPNNVIYKGTTPQSYDAVPAGQYSVVYTPLPGCVTPPAQSQLLTPNDRISLSVTMSCAMADKIRDRLQQNQSSNQNNMVSVSTIGSTSAVVLRDVPTTAWYASYVQQAAHLGILAGYTDEAGNPSGNFGPGDNVTIGQLAKIAHKLTGLSVDAFQNQPPANPNAQDQWFSPYIASAESHGWLIYADATVDPNAPATRSDVVVTLMQALDIPLQWQKGNLFTDVTVRTPFASAIETAANAHAIDGYKDDQGNPTHLFGPDDNITRAEMAKVVTTMLQVYKKNASSSSASSK
jgi:hypothetical protein